jgi:integrase
MEDYEFGSLLFAVAAVLWLASRIRISPRTRRDYQQFARALTPFFGDVVLKDIHPGMLIKYQEERSLTAGPERINKEIGMLLQVRRRAKIKDTLEDEYEALPLPMFKPPRTMTREQEDRFFQIASSKPEYEAVYHYAILSVNTSATGCEMRGLHVGDIDLFHRTIRITREHVKNRHRIRSIALIAAALYSAERLIQLASAKGSVAPHHYVLPFRICRGVWDPTRPCTDSWIKKTWDKIRKEAGVAWLRPHDLRHQINTKLAEAGVPTAVRMAICGHESPAMNRHYEGIRSDVQRRFMEEALEGALQEAARKPAARTLQTSASYGRSGYGVEELA